MPPNIEFRPARQTHQPPVLGHGMRIRVNFSARRMAMTGFMDDGTTKPTLIVVPIMSRPDQPETSVDTRGQSRPSLQDIIRQAEQSRAELARIQAAGQAIADLTRTLDDMVREEDAATRSPEDRARSQGPRPFRPGR